MYRRVYCHYVAPGAWVTFHAVMLGVWLGGGASHETLMVTLTVAEALLLGMTVVAARFWPTRRRAPERPMTARPRVPSPRWQQPLPPPLPLAERWGETVWERATRDGPRGPHDSTRVLPPVAAPVRASAPVVVAEPEAESAGTEYVSGYLAGFGGESLPAAEDHETRGWVSGALDRERARGDEEPEDD